MLEEFGHLVLRQDRLLGQIRDLVESQKSDAEVGEILRKAFAEHVKRVSAARALQHASMVGRVGSIPVVVDGVSYPSKRQACKALGIDLGVLNRRLAKQQRA